MRNPLNLLKGVTQQLSHLTRWEQNGFPLAVLLSIGLSAGWTSAQAASPDTAPPELKNTISQIDAAANSRNVQGVMQYYSPNFTHSDGLNRQTLQSTLTQLWQRYPKLTYSTQLTSWESQGNAIVAETVTKISGTQPQQGRDWTINSTIRSRQRFENQQIVSQEILSEQTQLTSGDKPPTVDVTLPEQVRTGQEFNYDAIVREPLGDDLLLGAAIQEPVRADKYHNANAIELEGLNGGGIFKVARPTTPGKYWVSSVLIHPDGMTVITQRLPVVGTTTANPRPNNTTPATTPSRRRS